MYRNLPTHDKDGRPIHLNVLDLQMPQEDGYAPVWAMILDRKGDGRWYRCTGLREWAVAATNRLYKGIQKRMWIEGWTAEELKLEPTELYGLCWRWVRKDVAELDLLTAARIKVRRKKRNLLDQRARKRRVV